MAKPIKYPRKLRMKLEKIASEADKRHKIEAHFSDLEQQTGMRAKELTPASLMWDGFLARLPEGSVSHMHMRGDDDQLTLHNWIDIDGDPDLPWPTREVVVAAPWEEEIGGS